MRDILHYGSLAPSAHNNQPWRFRYSENLIEVLLDEKRLLPAMDPLGEQCYISLGSAIENIRLAARHEGLRPQITYFPDWERQYLVAEIHLHPGQPPTLEEEICFQSIPRRVTVRKPYIPAPLPHELLESWSEIAAAEGVTLRLVTDPESIHSVARVIGLGDQLCFNQEAIQKEVYHWMRFRKNDVETKRDGLWINTFSFDPISRFMAPFLLRWQTMNALNKTGLNRILGFRTQLLARRASAFAILTVPKYESQRLVTCGQIFQRLALQATNAGIGFHPMSSALILCRLLQLKPHMFSPHFWERISSLRNTLQDTFNFVPEEEIALLFRIGYTQPLRDREPRRNLEEMLEPL